MCAGVLFVFFLGSPVPQSLQNNKLSLRYYTISSWGKADVWRILTKEFTPWTKPKEITGFFKAISIYIALFFFSPSKLHLTIQWRGRTFWLYWPLFVFQLWSHISISVRNGCTSKSTNWEIMFLREFILTFEQMYLLKEMKVLHI